MSNRIDLRRDDGATLVLVMFLLAVLSALTISLIATVSTESDRSAHALKRDASFQAAEAGIDDYVAKLVDDHVYYLHQVGAGEATRQSGATLVSAGGTWTLGTTWTYPNGSDHWRQLSNGYEYSLQITPPSAGSHTIRILATGRKVGSTDGERVIETYVRPSSIADYQRIVNGNVSWGSGATTNGKLYANGTIDHDGIATANIYAEQNITGSVTMQNGAVKYDHNTIRTQIKNPVNFNALLASLVDVQRAAQVGGVYLDDPAKHAWRLIFSSGGTFTAASCTRVSGKDVADTAPSCGSTTTYTVPSNGAIYTGQTAIVSGSVKGRVTVASNDNVVVADNIAPVTPGTDVLGLVAKNNLYGAKYAPYNLTWRAAVLAQSGTWRGWVSDGSHGTMTHTGSSTTNLGGDWTMFQTRVYSYDETLLYLPPPWFPTIEDAYTVSLFRELPAP